MNRYRRLLNYSSGCLLVIACASCSDTGNQENQTGRSIEVQRSSLHLVTAVSSYPLQYFCERIGREWIKVKFPVPAGINPANWTPDADAVQVFQNADRIFLNGADYETWTQTVTLPESKVVVTTESISGELIPIEETVTHSHGPEGEHSHTGIASTTWLDPSLAIRQAETILTTYQEVLTNQKGYFQSNFESLKQDLTRLDETISQVFAKDPQKKLLASHPVYQYLQRRYSLNLKSVHWEPNEMPDQKQWGNLESILKKHAASWMIWESTPKAEIRDRLKQMGIESLVFDPCGNQPDSGDYLSVMNNNLEALIKVYTE